MGGSGNRVFLGNTLHLRCLLDVLSVITNGKLLNAKCIFPKILEYTVFHFCYRGLNFCLTFHQPNAAQAPPHSSSTSFHPSLSVYFASFLLIWGKENKPCPSLLSSGTVFLDNGCLQCIHSFNRPLPTALLCTRLA